MTLQTPIHLACDEWLARFTQEAEHGYSWFDFLTAYESAIGLVVVARVLDPATHGSALYATSPGPAQTLPSLTVRYPGAAWHEREAAEMFGLTFIGLADPRPLLRREADGQPPLLKSTVLAARAVINWPGAAEPDPVDGRRRDNPSRRRMRPIGSPPADWATPSD